MAVFLCIIGIPLSILLSWVIIRSAVESAIIRAARAVDKERRNYPQRVPK